jgi:outer membrane protein
MMAKISIGLNILLIIAVGYLFSIQGSSNKEEHVDQATVADSAVTIEDGLKKLAFVRGDSIMAKYQYVLDQQDVLIKKAKSSESKLQRQMNKAQEEYTELVNYANSGSATESELQIAQERIMQLEYELQAMQAEEQNKIAKQEMEFQQELYNRISAFVSEYAESNGYEMVFNFEPTGQGLLYSSEAYDITSGVLKELNSQYQEEIQSKASE